MRFENIKWEGRSGADPNELKRTKSVWYECGHCGAKWDDASLNQAVQAVTWVERKTGRVLFDLLESRNPIKIGFDVPAWISPFVSLSECASEFLEGLKDQNKFKSFLNNIKNEPWKIFRKDREENRILALRDDRPRGRVPGGGVVAGITAAVDTQDYGFWFEIRAWGYGVPELSKESWCVREGYVTTWGDLERVLWQDELLDADGNRYVLSMVIQDALGHRTAEVYSFCLKHRGQVFPSFGRDTMAQPYTWGNQEFFPGTKKPIPGGLKSINVNTKYYKDELSRLLEIVPGDPSSWRYHAEFPEAHARHMTAEFTNDKGVWECPPHKENHLWDCAALNLVAADIQGIKFWPRPGDQPDIKQRPKPKQDKRGRW
jgi:phage terminase large subunit GpA-like protein